MHSFKDRNGKSWNVEITVADQKAVRDGTNVDLGSLVANQMRGLGELVSDNPKLVDVLYVLCKKQCDEATPPLTDIDFGRSFDGDALEAASDAFVEALIDFFPNPDVRKQLRKVLQKGRDVGIKTLNLAMARTEQALGSINVDEEAAKQLVRLTQPSSAGASNVSAGSSAESSE